MNFPIDALTPFLEVASWLRAASDDFLAPGNNEAPAFRMTNRNSTPNLAPRCRWIKPSQRNLHQYDIPYLIPLPLPSSSPDYMPYLDMFTDVLRRQVNCSDDVKLRTLAKLRQALCVQELPSPAGRVESDIHTLLGWVGPDAQRQTVGREMAEKLSLEEGELFVYETSSCFFDPLANTQDVPSSARDERNSVFPRFALSDTENISPVHYEELHVESDSRETTWSLPTLINSPSHGNKLAHNPLHRPYDCDVTPSMVFMYQGRFDLPKQSTADFGPITLILQIPVEKPCQTAERGIPAPMMLKGGESPFWRFEAVIDGRGGLRGSNMRVGLLFWKEFKEAKDD